MALKNRGALHTRARVLASLAWWGVLAAVIAITLVSFRVQPHLNQSFTARPWAYVFPLSALAGLFGVGQAPSGDKDPFGLRRAAIGVVRIIVEKKLSVSLPQLVSLAFEAFSGSAALQSACRRPPSSCRSVR